MIGLVEVGLVGCTLLAAITWVVVKLLAPGGIIRPSASAGSASSARMWLYAPLWVPLAALIGAVTPGLIGALVTGGGDHCLLHGSHHHHFCLFHPPHAAGHLSAWVLSFGVLLPCATILGLCAWRITHQARLVRVLFNSSRPSELGRDVRIVDRAEPLALTAGVWRPGILLSSGLLAGIDSDSLRAVLAHERAHVSRWDTRKALFDRLAASLVPSRVRLALSATIVQARERACDEAAAAHLGDRVTVARALTAVARLGLAAPAVGVSVVSGSLPCRVASLLEPPAKRCWLKTFRRLATLFGAVAAVVGLGAMPFHDTLEHVVSILVH